MKSPPPTQLSHPSAPAFLNFQYTGNYYSPSQIKVACVSGYLCVAPVQCLGCEETIKQPTVSSLEMGKVGVPARGRHIWPQSQLAPLDRTFSVGWQHPSPPSSQPPQNHLENENNTVCFLPTSRDSARDGERLPTKPPHS